MENANLTSSNSTSSSFSLHSNIVIFTIVFSIQFVFAVVENLLIVWIVYKDKRLRNTTNYLVTNMAVSDILAAICMFPLKLAWINLNEEWLVGGSFGQVLCKLSNFTAELSLAVSVYSCLFIAIDRYFAVAYPIKRPFQQPKIKVIIALIWVLSSFFKAPIFYYYGISVEDNRNFCNVPSSISSLSFTLYFYINNILTFGVIIIVVTIIYVLIVYKLRKHKTPGFQSNSTIRRKELQNRKVLKMSVTIVALFYLSWGSRSVFVILHETGSFKHLSREANFNLLNISFFMLYMSVVYNFFIYLFFNGVYRQNFKALVTKCRLVAAVNSIVDYSLKQSNSDNKQEKVQDTASVVEMKNIQERCST